MDCTLNSRLHTLCRNPGLEISLLGGDAERRVGSAVALVAAPLDDLEDEALAPGGGVELKELAVLVAVVEDVLGLQPIGQTGIEPEASFNIVIVVSGNWQGREIVVAER